ncbi:hypothetical protein CEXT_711521 [Caerostris extrusa]|uniref:Uncharacterized protein n=1 Tax=Caerostris extrusa TaxID=172846 RepID=A0AAV4N687_CAEEX|nr:hypothetical protein CEXT_711521 [Caerostris extrusa]
MKVLLDYRARSSRLKRRVSNSSHSDILYDSDRSTDVDEPSKSRYCDVDSGPLFGNVRPTDVVSNGTKTASDKISDVNDSVNNDEDSYRQRLCCGDDKNAVKSDESSTVDFFHGLKK